MPIINWKLLVYLLIQYQVYDTALINSRVYGEMIFNKFQDHSEGNNIVFGNDYLDMTLKSTNNESTNRQMGLHQN